VHGISGKRFPSPFAKPPGKGLSSSIINAVWGLANFAVALVLYLLSDGFIIGFNPGFIAFAVGFVIMSFGLSIFFQSADREV
jgi:hypothetical protein